MSIIRAKALGLALSLALGAQAQAQCVAPKTLGGWWNGNDGGKYVLRELGNVVWWLGKSADGGKQWTNVFRGVISGDTIDGEWTDLFSAVKENGSQGHGTLKLKIIGKIGNGVDGFQVIGGTGSGFGGSKWSQGCNDTN